MFLGLPYRLSEVIVAGDVVAVKDCPRPVSADRHRHGLPHTGSDHIPNPGPSQVMKHARRFHHNGLDDWLALLIEFRLHQASGFTRRRPGPSRVANGVSVSMKDILGNAGSARGLIFASSPPPLDKVLQLVLKHDLVR